MIKISKKSNFILLDNISLGKLNFIMKLYLNLYKIFFLFEYNLIEIIWYLINYNKKKCLKLNHSNYQQIKTIQTQI